MERVKNFRTGDKKELLKYKGVLTDKKMVLQKMDEKVLEILSDQSDGEELIQEEEESEAIAMEISEVLLEIDEILEKDTAIQHAPAKKEKMMKPTTPGVPRRSPIQAKKKDDEAYNTRCSQAVTHPGTDLALPCLTSVIGREPVYSWWYGRRRRIGGEMASLAFRAKKEKMMKPTTPGVPRRSPIQAKKKDDEAYNTRCSQAVTHPGTDLALPCLTSVIGREPVYSWWYGREKRKDDEAYNTRCSQAVTHPGTDLALPCLTSVIGREPVYSWWYGRRRRIGWING
eukprot:gene14107-5097_t